MLCWMLFALAILATARRSGPTPRTVDHADSRELLSRQEVSAVARAVTATEVCFEVQRSQSYSSLGTTSADRLQRGDYECVPVKDQDEPTQNALASLADGDLVRLRRSHFWAMRVVERGGFRKREAPLERAVTLLKVGSEVSRHVKGIQTVTANFQGSTKTEGTHMVVATGVNISSAELACFKVKSEMSYVNVPGSDEAVGKLHDGEKFCIRLDDQGSATLATIRALSVEDLVTMVLAHEMVYYEWKNRAGATESGTEWDFKLALQKGTQRNEKCTEEDATLTFESAKAVSASEGDYARQFCFKTVATETASDGNVCFLNNLQSVATQMKLLGFTQGQQVVLGWQTCEVSFNTEDDENDASDTQTATEENLIVSIDEAGNK